MEKKSQTYTWINVINIVNKQQTTSNQLTTYNDDGGTNKTKKTTTKLKTKQISKTDTPVVTLEFGTNLNTSFIREGADVYFECNIKSNPWVYKVSWRHNVSSLLLVSLLLSKKRKSRNRNRNENDKKTDKKIKKMKTMGSQRNTNEKNVERKKNKNYTTKPQKNRHIVKRQLKKNSM